MSPPLPIRPRGRAKPDAPLSLVMTTALADIKERGGSVHRHPGGFWSTKEPKWSGGAPDWYIGTTTVEALVARGRLEYTEWKDGRGFRFPITAALTADSASHLIPVLSEEKGVGR